MHNMACEERRETFSGSRVIRMRLDETEFPEPESFVTFLHQPQNEHARAVFWNIHLSGSEDEAQHFALQKALTKHLWKRRALHY